MTFTAPLGLLALLAVPAVLWLHLFRTRLPERAVAGLCCRFAARIGDTPTTHRDRVVRIAAKSGILACLDDTVAL